MDTLITHRLNANRNNQLSLKAKIGNYELLKYPLTKSG